MTSVFEFTVKQVPADRGDPPVVARIEAPNERKARAYLTSALLARKLSMSEVVTLTRQNKPIVDAETGQVIGAEVAGQAEPPPRDGGGGRVNATNPPSFDAE